jgi:hypothetical protein
MLLDLANGPAIRRLVLEHSFDEAVHDAVHVVRDFVDAFADVFKELVNVLAVEGVTTCQKEHK